LNTATIPSRLIDKEMAAAADVDPTLRRDPTTSDREAEAD
jgi:hypothetical protein